MNNPKLKLIPPYDRREWRWWIIYNDHSCRFCYMIRNKTGYVPPEGFSLGKRTGMKQTQKGYQNKLYHVWVKHMKETHSNLIVKNNPIESYALKARVLSPTATYPYTGYFIRVAGEIVSQSKQYLKRSPVFGHKTEISYRKSDGTIVTSHKITSAMFAYETSKQRDDAFDQLLTKMKKKYTIIYDKGRDRWNFTRKKD